MRSALFSVLTVLSLSAIAPAAAFPAGSFFQRAHTTNAADVADKSYDFVIVGGGLAGLVVASRLSEWSNTTVLVIEAGGDGSDVELQQTVPGFAYMRGLAFSSPYAWNYTTTNQCGLDTPKNFPLGRGLGGGSAVNGMFWTRPGSAEFDAWKDLNNATSWGWSDVDTYIKKAENLVPASADAQKNFLIINDDAAHGNSGPLKVGWSSYIYDITKHWVPTFQGLGFPARDLAGGNNRGVAIVPSTLDSAAGARADSNDYVKDDRPNLTILTGQHVTKLVFNGTVNGNVVASGVEFQADANGSPYTVKANKEVIVSSGAVGSPKVLQLSGIGPSSVLSPLNIPVNVDLPVGYNFQDHVMVQVGFDGAAGAPETWGPLCNNASLQEAALAEWQSSKSGVLTYINEASAYVSFKDIEGSLDIDVAATVKSLTDKYSLPESVQKGLTAQYNIMKGWLQAADIPQLETIMNLWGGSSAGASIESAVQHPWSRGTVFISSASAFDMPKIDPNYLGLDADISILTSGINFVRKLVKAKPLGDALANEVSPGADVTGDKLTTWMKGACGSEYHPIGSCSMLPRDMGGVVDTNLLVYGTANVRVIDASIAPLQVSAHTMAPAYGIAEKGADIIKAFYSTPADTTKNQTLTTGALPSHTGGVTTTTSKAATTSKASAASTFVVSWATLVGLLVLPLFL